MSPYPQDMEEERDRAIMRGYNAECAAQDAIARGDAAATAAARGAVATHQRELDEIDDNPRDRS